MATQSDNLEPENAKEKVTNLFDATGEKVKDVANEISKSAKNVTSSASETVSSSFGSLGGTMKKYPMQTFFVGLGLGALLGISATALKNNR